LAPLSLLIASLIQQAADVLTFARKADSVAAKMNFERGRLECLQIVNRLNANLLETVLGDFANAGNTPDRKRRREAVEVFGLNDEKAISSVPFLAMKIR
jgi:hypothetical protein